MKRLFLLLALLCPSLCFAQAGGILTGGITVLSSSGRPVAGATVTICNAADLAVPCTQTVNIYQDPALTIPAANPGKTDANGNFIAFASPGAYRFTATGNGVSTTGQPFLVTVSTPSAGGGNVLLAGNNAFTGNNTYAGTSTLNGNATLNGQNTLKAYNINNIVTVDGVKYTTANAALADSACTSSAGCTIDMRGNSSPAALNLGTFDPGTKAVTLLLGPYSYTVTQLVLESDFHVIGAGIGTSVGAATILQASSPTTDAIVLSQTHQPILHVVLDSFILGGATGNTSEYGIHAVASGSGNGIWYSTFKNLCVGGCAGLPAFGGGTIVFDATATSSINQFLDFRMVQGYRATTGNALQLVGTNAQFIFDNCEFDGAGPLGVITNDGGTNISISASSGSAGSNSITFNTLTTQKAGVAVKIAGSDDIVFIATHLEVADGAFLINPGPQGQSTYGITIIGSQCTDFCANKNGGGGYFVNTSGTSYQTLTSYKLIGNHFTGSPDNFLLNPPNNFMEIGDELNNGVLRTWQNATMIGAARFSAGTTAANLTCGAISFVGSWGTSPTCNSIVGTDSGFYLSLTSGSGSPGANPGIQLTFTGVWQNAAGANTPPVCIPTRTEASSPTTAYWVPAQPFGALQPTFQFVGTPAASTTYGLAVMCQGKQN